MIYPKEGWVEQDPEMILNVVRECISKAVDNLSAEGCFPSDIVAVGITNQRETVVAWDKVTGKPFYNAVGKCAGKINSWEDYFLTCSV